MATVKTAARTLWHHEATGILRQFLARRRTSYKELARLLEQLGEHEPSKSLSNKINRGTFSFQFFLKCLVALGSEDVRFSLPTLSRKELDDLRRTAKTRKRRTFPGISRQPSVKRSSSKGK